MVDKGRSKREKRIFLQTDIRIT